MERIDRIAARLLVVSSSGQVLLLRLEPGFREPFWVTPGGGLDHGESFEEAPARELREEVGRDLPIARRLWIRDVEFMWEDRFVHQEEHTYLVKSPDVFEPVVGHTREEPIVGGAWFDADAIRSLHETVYPQDLADLLEELLRHGAQSGPGLERESPGPNDASQR
jgi:8-oxo-dGTP pyrophosphatase MutT (NUDIX family)